MAYQYPLNGGRINASISGNSTSAGAGYQLVSTGTLVLAGGNNITLNQNGDTVSVSGVSYANSNGVSFGVNAGTLTASVNAVQSAQTIGGYASGNTTGQSSSTTFDARSMSISAMGGASAGFSGGMLQVSAPAMSSLSQTGIISLSQNGNTISIGAPAFSAGASNLGNTAGNTMTVSNQIVFAGGNNITLSQTTGAGGATMSIIGGAGGGGGGVALSANALISSGTASLAASGALTASVNGQTLNLSVPATSSIVGVNGITISTNGSTISISGNGGGGGGAVGRWEHPTAVFTTLPAIVNNSLSLQHVYMPFNFSGTEMKIGGSLSMGTHTSASTGSATINLKMGIYTLNGSTLSLLNSGSYSTGFGVSSNSTSSYNGMRQFAVTGSFNLSAGEYWVGAILSTATNYASNPLGYTVYGNSAAPTAASAAILSPFGSAVSASPRDVFLFQGMYGTTTTALPTAIQGSQINNSAASFVQRAQFYHAIYSATY